MEPRFGYDFSKVRVHTDARAAESAQAVNASAYTVGRNVVFGTGQYVPETHEGRRLLGHELTHVVQQSEGISPLQQELTVSRSDDAYEQQANDVAESVMIGRSQANFLSSGLRASIQRQQSGVAHAQTTRSAEESKERNPAGKYQGVFIGLRSVTATLKKENASTRARGLRWSESRLFGLVSHTVDWNPTLDSLAKTLSDVDGWISNAESSTAGKASNPSLAVDLFRIGETLRIVGMYLAAMRAAQYALHDAPNYVKGGLGFNEGIIDRANILADLLLQVRGSGDPAKLSVAIDAALSSTQSYIQSYFDGIEFGAQLLQAAQVIGIITAVIGIGAALNGIAKILAATAEGGGLGPLAVAAGTRVGTRVGIGSVGGGTATAITDAAIKEVLQGAAVSIGGGTLAMATRGDGDDFGEMGRRGGTGRRGSGRRSGGGKQDIQQVNDAARETGMTAKERTEFGKFLETEKQAGQGGTLNERGDFTYEELLQKAQEFLSEFRSK